MSETYPFYVDHPWMMVVAVQIMGLSVQEDLKEARLQFQDTMPIQQHSPQQLVH